MSEGFFIIGGGVWWNESRERLKHHISGSQPTEELRDWGREHPMHCIIGNRGYHSENESWPKQGYFCQNQECLSMVIRPTPRN